MKKLTNKEYGELVKKKTPNSTLPKNLLTAFWVGGTICALGQALKNFFLNYGLDAETAGTSVSIALIFLGVLSTALGLYSKLAKFAGAGTLIPITGFANAVAAPAMEFKTEGVIAGVCAKMFTIAGPVIVISTFSSMVYGIILLVLG